MKTYIFYVLILIQYFKFLSRVFCNNCVSVFCGQQSFNKIKREQNWACFACKKNSSISLACGLLNHSIEKQIKNVMIFLCFLIR